jgi:protein TonB
MKGGRPLWNLSGSLLLHGLALAAAVALVSRESPPLAILVEFEEAVRVSQVAPPAASSRGDSVPTAVHRGPPRPVRPAPPVVTRAFIPEPLSPAEPSPRPSSDASADAPAPLSAQVSDPPADASAKPQAPASSPAGDPAAGTRGSVPGSDGGSAGAIREVFSEGIQGTGPLAMVAPSGRGGGEGVVGGEGGMPAEFGPYLQAFRQRIQESLRYPLPARRRGLGGTVQLEVELLPTGKVASVVVRSSSSHAVLDQAALDTVSRLQPVPFPLGAPPRPLKVRLPIIFELK